MKNVIQMNKRNLTMLKKIPKRPTENLRWQNKIIIMKPDHPCLALDFDSSGYMIMKFKREEIELHNFNVNFF